MTPKQENFARAYVETGSASEAYRRTYNAGRMKPETIHKRASELLGDGEVTGRIAELQSQHAARHDITIDRITAELEEARTTAKENGNAAAMVSASMGKAKLHGLIVDRSKMTLEDSHEAWLARCEAAMQAGALKC